jgi:Right handed beta helix region
VVRTRIATAALVALQGALLAGSALAASTDVPAGATRSLDADLILAGMDTLTAGDPAGARCTIHGNGHLVVAADGWTGTLSIRNCDVDGLGTADEPALGLHASGSAAITIEGSRFSTSGQVNLHIGEHVSVIVTGNTIEADSLVPAVTLLLDSPPVFWVTGNSDGMKLFQGNRIFKARIKFTSTSGWMVGGATPAEGNILVGVRTGIELENANNMTVRGNYSHTLSGGMMWNQIKNLSIAGGDGLIIEHNVFWGRNWLVEMDGGGELRYNLLIDAVERGWVLVWADAGAKIHHNIAIATRDSKDSPAGGFVLEAGDATKPHTTEIFNNTLDTAGVCAPGIGAAVLLKGAAVLGSLRSNALVGVRVGDGRGAALVRADDPEAPAGHLLYSDYNLFYAPSSPIKIVYGVTVDGKTVRTDSGFGLHDVPAGGTVNQQTDPRFTSPTPRTFPFGEDDIRTGTTTTCEVLAYYRQAYAPGSDSPLIDAGDPAEGAGNDVGAVGAGVPNDADKFGRLCDETNVGQPRAEAAVFTCPAVGIGTPSGGGGTPTVVPHGITCVCDDGAAAARPGTQALVLGLTLLVLAARRRARQKQ